jgi:hypothetical protein
VALADAALQNGDFAHLGYFQVSSALAKVFKD